MGYTTWFEGGLTPISLLKKNLLIILMLSLKNGMSPEMWKLSSALTPIGLSIV